MWFLQSSKTSKSKERAAVNMLLTTHAISRLCKLSLHVFCVYYVWMSARRVRNLYWLYVCCASTACKHDFRRLKLRQEHVAFNFSVLIFIHCHLHNNAVIAVVNERNFEVNIIVPNMLREARRLEFVFHHIVVKSWDFLVCEIIKVWCRWTINWFFCLGPGIIVIIVYKSFVDVSF